MHQPPPPKYLCKTLYKVWGCNGGPGDCTCSQGAYGLVAKPGKNQQVQSAGRRSPWHYGDLVLRVSGKGSNNMSFAAWRMSGSWLRGAMGGRKLTTLSCFICTSKWTYFSFPYAHCAPLICKCLSLGLYMCYYLFLENLLTPLNL